MNKQQLASKIWDIANNLRGKIEASEYKDYILGFIFYKYLSDNEWSFLEANGFKEEDSDALTEDNPSYSEPIKNSIGYFIEYKNLFSSWIKSGSDFQVADVTSALNAFSRNIGNQYKELFRGILDGLSAGILKLGTNDQQRTANIRKLIEIINDIPTNSKDYDVLGFIYEYLIGMFAANAGKKAGEFYTPHEVSVLMAEIISYHLRDKKTIEIYDPTSGSGSLLINIGKSASAYLKNPDSIKYYAQELIESTYNLTKMNLLMRGIKPYNVCTRNADTLEDDWPPSKDNKPFRLDAVVSNPPYSQKWDPKEKDGDPRYRFGLAPKSKADYAFVLHDLYHLKPDGIMTIVLPHGVLFRGGTEGEIREKLIENNHIDAIIGLPANIFFGTGIPTIIMILKQERQNDDILFIDASKGFIKVGKSNKLRS
jgi:type I restriction enzyme M protein